VKLTQEQSRLVEALNHNSVFLSGPFGTGKTTAAMHAVHRLLTARQAKARLLVLAPQRTYHLPYLQFLHASAAYRGQPVTFLTMGGLARRMISLYWPILNDLAGFADLNKPPSFLTLESAQYFMAYLVSPLFEKGYFASLTIDRNRLYSQLLDDLNNAAIANFPHTTIGEKLSSAWVGDSAQLNVYANVQECINLFRDFCLQNNLLDFSLQIELFQKFIWPSRIFKQNLYAEFQHLVYDNSEEDPPFAHQLLREWLPSLSSALIIHDTNAGYRQFLGASPQSSLELAEVCHTRLEFTDSFTARPLTRTIIQQLVHPSDPQLTNGQTPPPKLSELSNFLVFPGDELRFYPQMVAWVSEKVRDLLSSGVAPHEIVILAPFMSGMLQFALQDQLSSLQIPVRSHRPSRALKDEPDIQALLTLSMLAHPAWLFPLSSARVARSFARVIDGLDPVRARLLADNLNWAAKDRARLLMPFSEMSADVRARVTYRLGAAYDRLREWLIAADTTEPLDIFISRLFGEVLSQPAFAFHSDLTSGALTANLMESIRKFRWSMQVSTAFTENDLGSEYIRMVHEGVIAAQYLQDWDEQDYHGAVMLSPAYTFLVQNRSVDYQFWLDINSPGWHERLLQPLTHPYVLSTAWQPGDKWDAAREIAFSQENLDRLLSGLVIRCRKNIFLGYSTLNVGGSDERGLLTRRIQTLFRQSIRETVHD